MRIDIITLLPELFSAYMGESIMKRAIEKRILTLTAHNLRDFSVDKHKTVDDYPYGGGPGMVLKPEPLSLAVSSVKSDGLDTHTILLSPQGSPFDQKRAEALSRDRRRLLLICGRYEGIDERIKEAYVDEEISVGDYVLTGGELPALVIIDAVVRLLPGALGDESSKEEESFSWGILDYPHYTRPAIWNGLKVPEVLLSGDHGEIRKWRRKEALRRTLEKRPDLLSSDMLGEEDKKMILQIREERDGLDKSC